MSSSAIPPAPPALPPTTMAAMPPVLTVAVASEAQALAKLPAGALVMATLDAVESQGVIQVTTPDGSSLELRLPPGLSLPPDAELGLQLINQGGSPALRLLNVNGRPWGALPLPGLSPPDPAALLDGLGKFSTQATQTPATMLPTPGAGVSLGLTATVVRGLPAQAQSPAPSGLPGFTPGQPLTPPSGLENLTPGTQMTVRIKLVAPPDGGMAAPPLSSGVETGTGHAPTQPGPQAASAPTTTQTVPPTTTQPRGQPDPGHGQGQGHGQDQGPGQGQGRPLSQGPGQMLTAAEPPRQPAALPLPVPGTATQAPGSTSPALGLQLPGTVTAHGAGGGAMVHTPAGILSLPTGLSLPPGSAVLLDVVGSPVPPSPVVPQPLPEGLSAEGWPALQDSAGVLSQADPQAAGQLLRMVPQATPRLATALSLFSGAIRSGDFKSLGTDAIGRGLERAGRRDLAQRLGRDLKELADDAARPRGDGDWQLITMPFAHGAQIDPIHLYVPRVKGDEPRKQGGGHEQRFILDVSMSRLGRIQFDGLVQKDIKRFDLIIRSDAPLSADIRHGILGIFAESGQLTGIKGGVTFQSGRGFVELPPADTTGTEIVV